jgi:tetratricopeptide (TPR) repeat protein
MKGKSMARRRINWKFLIVLIITVAILGITAFGLRKWQRGYRASAGLEVGNKAYDEGAWQKAASNLGRYLAVEQKDVEILLKYADAHVNIRPLKPNNIQQAGAAYRTVLRLDKGNLEAATKLTEIYLGMGMPGEAELIAKRQLEADSILQKDRKRESRTNQDPELRRMLALALAQQRKFDEATAELRAIIEKHPEQVPAYETLGQLTALGQLTELHPGGVPATAEYWFDEAIKNNPSSAQAFIIRAAFHLRNKNNAKALNDLEQAQTLDLSDPLIRLRLATEFVKANMFDKARAHLVEVQAEDPTNQALWRVWAMLALETKSKEEMRTIAQTGLEELASYPWDFMPIATELFIHCGEFGPAAQCLDKLKQKDIEHPTVTFLEGLLAEAEKQDHKAILSWRKAIQLGNKSEKIQLALAAALSRAGDRQLAIRQLRTLVSEQPYLLQARLDLARLLSQTGNWAETAEQARLAMQIASNSLDAELLYIQAQLRLAESNPMISKAQIWQEVEKRLTELDNLAGGTPQVKILRFQLAMQRGQFADAERLLTNLKEDDYGEIEIAIAETDLFAAQGKVDQAISKLYVLTEHSPQTVLPVRYLATLLAKHRGREDCKKVIKDAMQRIEGHTAKRDLGLLLAYFYGQWAENDKAYQLLTALSQQLPYDIPVKRQLLKCEQVTKDLNQAQQLVEEIKAIEGEDGWQWRYEQFGLMEKTSKISTRR